MLDIDFKYKELVTEELESSSLEMLMSEKSICVHCQKTFAPEVFGGVTPQRRFFGFCIRIKSLHLRKSHTRHISIIGFVEKSLFCSK